MADQITEWWDPSDTRLREREIDLRPGKVKVKLGGGIAGHNGLRSLDAHIGKEYWRVRLGIGHPGDKDLVHFHVLHDFAKDEQTWLQPLLTAVAEELPLLLDGDDGSFMSRVAYRTNPPKPKPAKPEETGGGDDGL